MKGRAVLAAALALLIGGCDASAGGDEPAATPAAVAWASAAATVPASTTTTWPLPTPAVPPEEEYFDEEVATVGRISMPVLGLDDDLQEGLSLHNIDLGPSHWPGTAMPGELGNVVIAGHRVTHSRPFRDLDELGPGDTVTFTVASGTYTYEWIEAEVVTPDRVDIATQLPAYTATLFACHPPGSARERIVAYFRLVGSPAPGALDPATLPLVEFPVPAA